MRTGRLYLIAWRCLKFRLGYIETAQGFNLDMCALAAFRKISIGISLENIF